MSNRHTIHFELEQEGSSSGLRVQEEVQVELVEGLWKVTSPDGHASRVGYGRSKHEAICRLNH